MPKVTVNGVQLYYEEAGSGLPLLFIHEFAGDYRSWEPQMRALSARYRCITYSQRGYLPSDVPEELSAYSQDQMVEDARGLLDALGIAQAHLCGLSMGSFTSLLFSMKYTDRALSCVVAGGAYGSGGNRQEFHERMSGIAQRFRSEGTFRVSESYTLGPARVQLKNRNPRAWEEFARQFVEHSNIGYANMLEGVQCTRPDILELGPQLEKLTTPVLVLLGDEDIAGLEGSLYLKKMIPRCGLEIYARNGHVINLEEPARFNRSLLEFLTAVESGKWGPRDPKAMTGLV